MAADSDHSKTFSTQNSHVAKNADEVQLWLCTSICFSTWSLCLRSKQTSHTQAMDCGLWYICMSCINQIRFEHISFQRSLLWNCLHAGSTGARWCSDFLSLMGDSLVIRPEYSLVCPFSYSYGTNQYFLSHSLLHHRHKLKVEDKRVTLIVIKVKSQNIYLYSFKNQYFQSILH